MPAYSRFQPPVSVCHPEGPQRLKLKSNFMFKSWGLQQLNTSLNLSSSSVKL